MTRCGPSTARLRISHRRRGDRDLGARVLGAGTDTIEVEGRERLGGCEYDVLPDRIETGTFLAAGAITGGRVRVRGARPDHLDADSLPAGVLHPRRIRNGVVAGVADYGNKIGLPTVAGAVLYDGSATIVFGDSLFAVPIRRLWEAA